jgi:hypothetical protein
MSTNDKLPTKAAIEAMPCCPHVLFVGMHNKPGMKPLDSKTMSGKMIDAVIKELPFKCSKTNLCEVEYFPKDKKEIWSGNLEWNNKYQPTDESIIVLLGQWVQKNFLLTNAKIVKLPHPASCMGSVNKENYIRNAITRIKDAAS